MILAVPYFQTAAPPRGFGQISLIANAIEKQEGFYPGSSAYTNNNPGNLMASSWTQSQPGYVGSTSGGLAIFDSLADGQAAMNALITNYANNGATIASMLAAWAPASVAGNNPALYAQNVASAAGVSPDTPLSQVLSGGDSSSPPTIDLSSLGLPDFSLTLPDLSQSTLIPGVPDWLTWLGAAGTVVAAVILVNR